MPYDISEIKALRKRLGITQSQLASHSGVSQSLVAKIEAGEIDPSYSKARRILEFLEGAKHESGLKASDLMRHSIISVSQSSGIKEAVSAMRKHGISQLPVISAGRCIGLVSESILLDSIISGKQENVVEIMGDAPPVISRSTSASAVSDLLRSFPIVLVSDRGRIAGLITKSDVISKLGSR